MMRKTKAYRPAAAEALEDRAVPTTGIASLPSVDAQKVMDAFRAFETTYYQDVQTILMAPGTTSPSANRAAFDSAISSAANNLNTSIDKTIATLPSASTLQSTIQNQVAGASQSMVTQLQAIPTPKEVASGALKAFSRAGVGAIEKVATHVTGEVANSPAPVGTIDDKTLSQIFGKVQTAFRTFGSSYANEIKTVLAPTATTDPSSNRAAFNTAVGKDLATLNASIASAVSGLPTSLANSLTAIASNDLLTGTPATGKSLQEVLLGLKSPKNREGGSMNNFKAMSLSAMGAAEMQLGKDMFNAVVAYNVALGTPTTPTTPQVPWTPGGPPLA